MKTDEGLQLTVACEHRAPRIFHPSENYALTTRKVGDTTDSCEAVRESYTTLEECMNKLGALAQEFRGRPSYMVFNNIPSDVGMMCRESTDYVRQELEREEKKM